MLGRVDSVRVLHSAAPMPFLIILVHLVYHRYTIIDTSLIANIVLFHNIVAYFLPNQNSAEDVHSSGY